MNEAKRYWLERDFVLELLKQLPAHVFWKDTNSVYLGCNNSFAESLGLSSPEEIIGKTDFDLPTTKKENEAFRRDDKEVMRSKLPKLHIEEKQTLPEGKEVTLLTNKVPLFDRNNNLVGILGIYNDITDRKKSEIAKAKQKQSEKIADNMRLIASSIAHELRTPLGTVSSGIIGIENFLPTLIDGYLKAEANQLIEKNKIIRKDKLETLSKITKGMLAEVQSANFVINLLLKNITPKGEMVEKGKCSAQSIIHDAVSTYPFNEEEYNLIHVDKAVDFEFMGDQALLKHVLYNLIRNALFFITDARKGEVSIWCKQGKDTNEIHFKDTAKGVPPEILKHLFDAFYSKRLSGTGVGLAFCKMVVEKLDGRIECKSVEGEFLEYTIFFPNLVDTTETGE